VEETQRGLILEAVELSNAGFDEVYTAMKETFKDSVVRTERLKTHVDGMHRQIRSMEKTMQRIKAAMGGKWSVDKTPTASPSSRRARKGHLVRDALLRDPDEVFVQLTQSYEELKARHAESEESLALAAKFMVTMEYCRWSRYGAPVD
jgi:hypothetical protein